MKKKIKYKIALRPGQTIVSGETTVEGERVGNCSAVRRGKKEHFRGRMKPPPWIVDHVHTGMKMASCRKKRDCITAAKGLEQAGGKTFCTRGIKKLQTFVHSKKGERVAGYGRYLWEHYVHGYKGPVKTFEEWRVK